jgi:hypothetical protein
MTTGSPASGLQAPPRLLSASAARAAFSAPASSSVMKALRFASGLGLREVGRDQLLAGHRAGAELLHGIARGQRGDVGSRGLLRLCGCAEAARGTAAATETGLETGLETDMAKTSDKEFAMLRRRRVPVCHRNR